MSKHWKGNCIGQVTLCFFTCMAELLCHDLAHLISPVLLPTKWYLLLLSGTDQPEYSACHCPLTVEHILIECPALTSTLNKHFTASSIKDLFDNVAAQNIINFIKESHFYSMPLYNVVTTYSILTWRLDLIYISFLPYHYNYLLCLFIAFNINHSGILPLKALKSLYCADVPLSNYSFTHSAAVV